MTKIYTNIMLDLETMGTAPTAAIVAIGAVMFGADHAHPIGKTFYARVDLKSAVEAGGTMDPDTVLWWLGQSAEARAEITRPAAFYINDALLAFQQFIGEAGGGRPQIKVWGNGASFDNVILRGAYERAGIPAPWEWRNDRCYRTLAAQRPDVPYERIGTHHNALDDAISQARHLLKITEVGPL